MIKVNVCMVYRRRIFGHNEIRIWGWDPPDRIQECFVSKVSLLKVKPIFIAKTHGTHAEIPQHKARGAFLLVG